ncbi:MAG: TIGR02594 family protein [Bdellovibrionales bacterium]
MTRAAEIDWSPRWYTQAQVYEGKGIKEYPGALKNNPIILRWANQLGLKWITNDEVPWCALFVGACLRDVGIKAPASAAAKSYLNWGRELTFPHRGAIAVLDRKNAAGKSIGGHVAFVAGRRSDGKLMLLGGNQSNKVCIVPVDPARVISYRWPDGVMEQPGVLPLFKMSGDMVLSVNEA